MKSIISVCFLIFGAVTLSGQDIEYAREIIRTLASPSFAGRGYVSGGHDRAAEYIRSQYELSGLKPFGKDYFQPFEITVNTFPSTVELRMDGEKLVPGKDYIVDPQSPSFSGTYDVHVIGKEDLLGDNWQTTIREASSGKMLIIDERHFPTDDRERLQQANERLKFLKQNPQFSHVATIVWTSAKLTWSMSKIQAVRPAFTVQTDRDPSAVKKVGVKLKSKLLTCKTRNVVGYIRGYAQPDSFLVITAHYDHLGMMGKKACFYGANDNASGVSMLLNMAKHFSAHPYKYSVVFIATAAEEVGIVGAEYFASHPLFPLDNIRFLVNFDMAGSGVDGIQVVNGSIYQDKFDLMTRLNDEHHYLPSVRIRGESCNSDHCPFYRKGVPSFFIYTLGGFSPYHDIYDRSEALPLTAFENYFRLMVDFFNQI
jgi:hypothetical protein